MKEIWKPVVSYEGIYSISNFGRIKRDKKSSNNCYKAGRILNPSPNNKGYLATVLCKNKYKTGIIVSHLVAKAFIGPRPEGLQINHIDGNKLNNHISNLEYVTPGENTRHAWKIGLNTSIKGEKHGHSKLTQKQIIEIRNIFSEGFFTQTYLSRKYKISTSSICRIVRRKGWKHI